MDRNRPGGNIASFSLAASGGIQYLRRILNTYRYETTRGRSITQLCKEWYRLLNRWSSQLTYLEHFFYIQLSAGHFFFPRRIKITPETDDVVGDVLGNSVGYFFFGSEVGTLLHLFPFPLPEKKKKRPEFCVRASQEGGGVRGRVVRVQLYTYFCRILYSYKVIVFCLNSLGVSLEYFFAVS